MGSRGRMITAALLAVVLLAAGGTAGTGRTWISR
jgi:hypothetical protein